MHIINKQFMNSSAIKRLRKEYAAYQNAKEPLPYKVYPLESDFLIWHFTFEGPPDSPYEGGLYHGKFVFPPNYPFKGPSFYMLTANGRFNTDSRICLSNTDYHPESWNPMWDSRTMIIALIVYMMVEGAGSVGALNFSKEERIKLAKESLDYKCAQCAANHLDWDK